MGSAIARGLAEADPALRITVANPSAPKLQALSAACPGITTTRSNAEAAHGADLVILAVKPWLAAEVLSDITSRLGHPLPLLVSIAAGVGFELLRPHAAATILAIPDTAVAVRAGMTFIVPDAGVSADATEAVRTLFALLGEVDVIAEAKLPAAMALSSCGIAYAFKYVQACTQAGVELGLTPAQARRYTVATIAGAAALLGADPGTDPQSEIDRVTTPGGLTIRGINQLERSGFTAAVIDAILKPLNR